MAMPRSSSGMPDSFDHAAKEFPQRRGEHAAEVRDHGLHAVRPPRARSAPIARMRRCPRGRPCASGRSPRAPRTPSSCSEDPATTVPDPRRGNSSPGSHSSRPARALAPAAVVDGGHARVLDGERLAARQQPARDPLGVVPGGPERSPRQREEGVLAVEHRRHAAQRVQLVPGRRRVRLAHRAEAVHRPAGRPRRSPRRRVPPRRPARPRAPPARA